MTPRFRPRLHTLEPREVPTVNVLYNGASLTLSGTPNTGPGQLLNAVNTGGNNFAVSDGGVNLGTYHVTQNLSLKLTEFDTFVGVDLAGAVLLGGVLVDLGAGDRTPESTGFVFVTSSAAGARVGGDVTFKGGAGAEKVGLATDGPDGSLEVGGGVRATGKKVTTPVEDTLLIDRRVTVDGTVNTSRYTYTTINGTVNGDVTADAADSPGGMGFGVYGTVHGSVTATGGVTAKDTDAIRYYSFASINGTVDGDVNCTVTGGRAYTSVGGRVGGDVSVRAAGGPVSFTLFYGAVGGDLTYIATGNTASSVNLYGDAGDGVIHGTVGGDVRVRGAESGSTSVYVDGLVHGDVTAELGGPNSSGGFFNVDGRVDGSVRVTAQGKYATAFVGDYGILAAGPVVGGELTIKFGNGTNALTLDAAQLGDHPIGSAVGGKLTYTGGTGSDTVSISGRNTFRVKLDLGGGDGSVSLAPDATLGGLDLDYGNSPGVKTWTPPAVITFPVKIKNL